MNFGKKSSNNQKICVIRPRRGLIVCHFRWLHLNPLGLNSSQSRHCWLVPQKFLNFFVLQLFLSFFSGASSSSSSPFFFFFWKVFIVFSLRNLIKTFNEIQLSDNEENWINIKHKRWKFLARLDVIIAGNRDVNLLFTLNTMKLFQSRRNYSIISDEKNLMILRLGCVIEDSLVS